jgi:hypothetical protein
VTYRDKNHQLPHALFLSEVSLAMSDYTTACFTHHLKLIVLATVVSSIENLILNLWADTRHISCISCSKCSPKSASLAQSLFSSEAVLRNFIVSVRFGISYSSAIAVSTMYSVPFCTSHQGVHNYTGQYLSTCS